MSTSERERALPVRETGQETGQETEVKSEALTPLPTLSSQLKLDESLLEAWAVELPFIQAKEREGVRCFDPWEVELLTQAKDFYVGYQRNLERTRDALERWVSRRPRPAPPALDPEDDLLELSTQPSQAGSLPPLPSHLARSFKGSTPPQAESLSPTSHPSSASVSAQQPQRVATAQAQLMSSQDQAQVTAMIAKEEPHLERQPELVSREELNHWKAHFQEAQRELRHTREELERAQDKLQQRHAALKQLQADFNALKELIRKEIYDLRDLVVDKESERR